MARYFPPEKIPIEKVLEIARKIRILADNIDRTSQAIAATKVKEPWIYSITSAESAIERLTNYSTKLFAQLQKMEMGDFGGPEEGESPTLTERGREIMESVNDEPEPRKTGKKRKT